MGEWPFCGALTDRLSQPAVWALVRLAPLLGLLLFVSLVLDPGRQFTGDQQALLGAAHRLLQGRYAVTGTMTPVNYLWHGPGLPALLAPLVALHVSPSAMRLTTPLMMFVAVLLFYRMLHWRLNRRLALAGAYALGLYIPSYYIFGALAKEPLALAMSVVALDGTARYLQIGRPRNALAAGVGFGALAMTRLEYGVVITLLLGVGLLWSLLLRVRGGGEPEQRRLADRWVVICAVGMVACLPWLTYTYSLTGRLFYWGNAGGLSLYWMTVSGPGQFGQWHSAKTVFRSPALAGYRPLFHHLAAMTPVQADVELQHLALVQALGNPLNYLIRVIENVGRMLIGFPFGFTVPLAAVAALVLINGTLISGSVAALRAVRRGGMAMPRELVPFLLFALVGFAIHLFPTAEPRMILPIVPVPIWVIAHALGARRRTGARAQAGELSAEWPGSAAGRSGAPAVL